MQDLFSNSMNYSNYRFEPLQLIYQILSIGSRIKRARPVRQPARSRLARKLETIAGSTQHLHAKIYELHHTTHTNEWVHTEWLHKTL